MEMTIEQVEIEKESLERIIRDTVGEIVANWNARKTGLPVNSISIGLVNVTPMGGPKETIVTDVDVDFGIRL